MKATATTKTDRAIPGSRKVIVIGAGAAGLSCAHTLDKRGIDVLVLESAARAGGRMSGEEVKGFHISTGAQFFDRTYRTALGLAGDLGVPTGSLRFSGSVSQYTGGALRRVSYANLLLMRLYSPRALGQAAKLMARIARRKRDLSAADHAGLLDLDSVNESFADYGARHGGRELVEQMCDPLARSMVLAGPDRIGTVFGLRSLWSSLGNPSQAFRNPRRGVGSFASALSHACADFTRLSTPVERVVVEGGGVKGVVTRDGFQEAAAVVCATTATAAVQIVPNLPASVGRALSEVTYSSSCHVVFGVDGQHFPKGVYLMVFPRSAGFSLASLANAHVASPGAVPADKSLIHAYFDEESSEELFSMRDEQITARAIREIQRVVPTMPDAPHFTRVYRWKEAVCLSPGGTLSAMHRLRTEAIAGADGLFLAGEYMGIPGVEGSLKSGVEAADRVARYIV